MRSAKAKRYRVWAHRKCLVEVRGIGRRRANAPRAYLNHYDRLVNILKMLEDFEDLSAQSHRHAFERWVNRNNCWLPQRPRINTSRQVGPTHFRAETFSLIFDVYVSKCTWRGSNWFWHPIPPHVEDATEIVRGLRVACPHCGGAGECVCQLCENNVCWRCKSTGVEIDDVKLALDRIDRLQRVTHAH